jgi:hypothetical protein
MASRSHTPPLKFRPATASRWTDLEILFGERGACGGCWCMFWRLPRKQWEAVAETATRGSQENRNYGRPAPGIWPMPVTPVGWCAIAPDNMLPSSARILKPIDDEPVWSISCLFIKRRTGARAFPRCY